VIDREMFKQQMALLADRLGRKLAGPTQVEYYRQLNAELTGEQFLGAMALMLRTWPGEFRTWPSPQQIVEVIRPVAAPNLSAFEAFERVLGVMADPRLPIAERRATVQAMGAATMRAFLAAGGNRAFVDVLEVDVVWLRKAFVAMYEESCAHADAEQQAFVALGEADTRLQLMARSIAEQKAMSSGPAKQLGN
jgi:hypothetical protein